MVYISGPQPLGPGFLEDNFSVDRGWGSPEEMGRSSGSNSSKALLAGPPLTACSAAQLLTGHGLVLVRGPGVGDP